MTHLAAVGLALSLAFPPADPGAPPPGPAADGLEYLVPALAGNPYRISSGTDRFRRRISVSPALGVLGDGRLSVLRFAYNPEPWLGYEASIAHAPGSSVHALFHMLSAVVRVPRPGRWQPYATLGYGMMLVFRGHVLNADPVTENALAVGGGIEFHLRDDVAVRAEVRHLTVLGDDRRRDDAVAYHYGEATLGFAFSRSLGSR